VSPALSHSTHRWAAVIGVPVRTRRDRVVTIGVAATVVIVTAGGAAQLIDYGAYGMTIRWMDSSADGGLFGAAGDAALAAAAIASGVVLVRTRRRRAATIALPPLLAFLAVDKVFRLHDHVPQWLALYLPLLAASAIALFTVASVLPDRERHLITFGLGLLAASFVARFVGEALVRELGGAPDGLAYQLKAVVKHSAELAGWLLCAVGMAAGALHDRPSGVQSRLEGM
jgi:hypothetical protein